MYGRIITATGWSFHAVDELTLVEVNELASYWKDNPPACESLHTIRRMLGVALFDEQQPAAAAAPGKKAEEQDFSQLLALFGQDGVMRA